MIYIKKTYVIMAGALGIGLSGLMGCKMPEGQYERYALDVKRATDPTSCKQVKSDAQDIYIQWVRDRVVDGMPVKSSIISKIMALGTAESGGCRYGGVNFACVAGHGKYSFSNRSGTDGTVFANFKKLTNFLEGDKHPMTHQTNYGGLQISPDFVALWLSEYLNGLSKFSQSDLNRLCLVDLAYNAESIPTVTEKLNSLLRDRAQTPDWIRAVARYARLDVKSHVAQSRCLADPLCVEGSKKIGLWLSACPRFNLDAAYMIAARGQGPGYWGTWYDVGAYCQPMVTAEIRHAESEFKQNWPTGSKESYFVDVTNHKRAANIQQLAHPALTGKIPKPATPVKEVRPSFVQRYFINPFTRRAKDI